MDNNISTAKETFGTQEEEITTGEGNEVSIQGNPDTINDNLGTLEDNLNTSEGSLAIAVHSEATKYRESSRTQNKRNFWHPRRENYYCDQPTYRAARFAPAKKRTEKQAKLSKFMAFSFNEYSLSEVQDILHSSK